MLPAPPAAAVKITEGPAAILRLRSGRTMAYASYYRDAATVMPVAHLSFRYGPVEVDSSERERLEVFQGGQVYALSRRRALESDVLKRLSALDFVNARSVYSYLEGGHFEDLTFETARGWLDFLNHRAEELRAEGFEIHIDDDFPYRLTTAAGAFDAELKAAASTGSNWRSASKSRRTARSCADAGNLGLESGLHAGHDQKTRRRRR